MGSETGFSFEAIACEVLGLPTRETVEKAPPGTYHFIGHFKIEDSLEAVKAVMRAWQSRIIDVIVDETDNNAQFQGVADTAEYQFCPLSFKEYEDAVRRRIQNTRDVENPDIRTGPRIEHFVAYWSTEYFTPDLSGYLNYIWTLSNGEKLTAVLEKKRPVYIPEEARLLHTYATGTTGAGKSTLMKAFALSSVRHGPKTGGMFIIDPSDQGTFAKEVAGFHELVASDRLIYLEFAENFLPGHAPLINPLEKYKGERTERRVGLLKEALSAMVGKQSEITDQMRMILDNALPILIEMGGQTINNFYRLLGAEKSSPSLKNVVDACPDDDDRNFFETDFFSSNFKSTRTSLRSRLHPLRGPATRHLFCGKSTINIEKELNAGKIIIVDLGGLDPQVANGLGRFFVTEVQAVGSRRQGLEKDQPPVHLFIDECHRFVGEGLMRLLLESRKAAIYGTLLQPVAGDRFAPHERAVLEECVNLLFGGRTQGSKSIMPRMLGVPEDALRELPGKKGQFWCRMPGTKHPFKLYGSKDVADDNASVKTNSPEWRALKDRMLEEGYYRPIEKSAQDNEADADDFEEPI